MKNLKKLLAVVLVAAWFSCGGQRICAFTDSQR